MNTAKKSRVILRRCNAYEPRLISGIISESLTDLGFKPHGKTLIKPNVVSANKALSLIHI